MKFYLITAFVVLLGCSKDDNPDCKTCYENVKFKADNSPTEYYIQSATKYCSGEWEGLEGQMVITSGTTSGHAWTRTVITNCQ